MTAIISEPDSNANFITASMRALNRRPFVDLERTIAYALIVVISGAHTPSVQPGSIESGTSRRTNCRWIYFELNQMYFQMTTKYSELFT